MKRLLAISASILFSMLMLACPNPAGDDGDDGGDGDGGGDDGDDDPINVTISYNGNGNNIGSPPSSTSALPGASGIVLSGPPGMCKFYSLFTGWNTAADGSGNTYRANESITMPSASMTLYARWLSPMHPVPAKSFRTGTGDAGSATIGIMFLIGRTEVTYDLWYMVHQWATSHGYTFANPGREGDSGSIGAAPTDNGRKPVTTVNWRDAVIWCNAFTEWLNFMGGSTYTCVYYEDAAYTTPRRSSADGAYGASIDPTAGGLDAPYVKADANGFALPTADQWELAARYIGDWNNDGDILDAGEFSPGNYASGATAAYTNTAATDAVATMASNPMTLAGAKAPNALLLYDMSGNVNEWVFDEYTAGTRNTMGGEYVDTRDWAQIGRRDRSLLPYSELGGGGHPSKGFRVVLRDAAMYPAPYRVRYLGTGSTSGTVPLDETHYGWVTSDDVYYRDAGTLARTGYYFAGWGVDRDGDGEINDDGSVVLDDVGEYFDAIGNTTMIPQWTIGTYTLTYYGNGNTGGSGPAQAPYVYQSNFTAASQGTLLKTGYVFLGWNTSYDGMGTIYRAGSVYPMPGSHLNLFAQWARLDMVTVPAKSFSTGTNDLGSGSVAAAFKIATTEVSYELWYKVMHYVYENNDYTMINAGNPGQSTDASGAAPVFATMDKPVSNINWRDAIVWCNALTWWYNQMTGSSLTYVYCSDTGYTSPHQWSDDTASVNTTAGSLDNPYVNPAATGFRLPTSMEWELAARYIADNNPPDGDIKDIGEAYPGNYASGAWYAHDAVTDTNSNGVLDGKEVNDRFTVYGAYWNGTSWVWNTYTNPNVASKYPNALGLYDMSGSMTEWSFDWYQTNIDRITRGGAWDLWSMFLQVGVATDAKAPYHEQNNIGFRVVQKAP